MTNTVHPNRPWYVRADVVDEYRDTLTEDDEKLPVLKTLKLVRAIIVNAGIIFITYYSISNGGPAGVLGFTGLTVLGAYNGLELTDYLALLQAYQEVQEAATNENTTDDP